MKKLISLSLVLIILLGILAVPALADGTVPVGTLSYLSMTEEDENTLGVSVRAPMLQLLFLHGVLTEEGGKLSGDALEHHHFDTLNDLLMALTAGTVKALKVPYYTAVYLCSTNDELQLTTAYHPEKASAVSKLAIDLLSDGYSFMMKQENTDLRDAFDAQITAMKEDGTLQRLIDEHIVKVAEGGEPVAIDFEEFEGDPIKIAVTGSLPPMDYVSPDGTFAGFNTAVLAEIGRRLQKNIELVQVDSMGRSLALSEGVVDAVFWRRGMSEGLEKQGADSERPEELLLRERETMTEEEKAIITEDVIPDEETIMKIVSRDMAADTISTRRYFSDFPVLVILKETP